MKRTQEICDLIQKIKNYDLTTPVIQIIDNAIVNSGLRNDHHVSDECLHELLTRYLRSLRTTTKIRLTLEDSSMVDNSTVLCEITTKDLNKDLKTFKDKLKALRHSLPEKEWKLEVITTHSNGIFSVVEVDE